MTHKTFARLGLITVVALGPAAPGGAALAAQLNVIAPNAVKHAVEEIAKAWSKTSGITVKFTWTGSEAITRRIEAGEAFDMVITTDRALEALAENGKVAKDTTASFARSAVAVAVGPDVAKPDVSTVEGLKAAIRNAKTIAISSGASGRYLEQLFNRLGLADEIKGKIRQPPSGAQIGDLLARGEAELGFQQVTELIDAKGFQYVGTLPREVQNYTVWAGGLLWSGIIHTHLSGVDHASEFLNQLSKPQSGAVLLKTGLEPIVRH